jgi:hypothetical protein
MNVGCNKMKQLIIVLAFLSSTFLCSAQENIRYEFINGEKLIIYNDYTSFIVTRNRKDTLINVKANYFNIEFKDLDKDGNVDILGDWGGHIPERYDLFLFVGKTGQYRRVDNFSKFPAPVMVSGTKYYYSYHKSGCADMDWDSDLFYLSNYKAIRIGTISGLQCFSKDEPMGIFIYKVSKGKKILINKLKPEATAAYEEGKWGFIKDYWTSSWKKFVP